VILHASASIYSRPVSCVSTILYINTPLFEFQLFSNATLCVFCWMSLSSFLHLFIVLCNFRKKVKNRKESRKQLQEETGEDKLSKDDSDDEILGSILK